VKNDDVMDLIVVFCILFVFMLVLYCFCVATEFSVNKDLYATHVHGPLSRAVNTYPCSQGTNKAREPVAVPR